jgi:hypothetical protein
MSTNTEMRTQIEQLAAAEQWTVAQVKAKLPAVRVRVGKRNIVDARLSGRLNQFATVSITNNFPRSGVPLFADYQFAWETIAHSLNTGQPLSL